METHINKHVCVWKPVWLPNCMRHLACKCVVAVYVIIGAFYASADSKIIKRNPKGHPLGTQIHQF